MTSNATTGAAASAKPRKRAAGSRRGEASEELQALCNRPSCRRPFSRTVGPGRPQLFCSEVCRRGYEGDLRKAKTRLAHFEECVAACRADLDTFLLGADQEQAQDDKVERRQQAAAAVHRVAGVLAFLGDNDHPLAHELRQLHAAVAPVIVDD